MMNRTMTLATVSLLVWVACGTAVSDAVTEPSNSTGDAAVRPAGFAERLRAIAAQYQEWGRVDDERRAKWAPMLCRMPSPGKARFSDSDDSDTHGRKLYFLFAKDAASYAAGDDKMDAVGQVVVKEAWVPEAHEGPKPGYFAIEPKSERPYGERDGVVYAPAGKHGLFVMYRLAPDTPGTDDGWVYGTIDSGGKVTAVGRIESCMTCHEDADHGRLFGL